MRFENGRVRGPAGEVSLSTIARTWYRRPQDLPADVDAGGLEATSGYAPAQIPGLSAMRQHGVVVAVGTPTPVAEYAEILDSR